jgi:hypothetical protein
MTLFPLSATSHRLSMNSTSKEKSTMNGEGEKHTEMDVVATADSMASSTIQEGPAMSSDDETADSLQTWAADLMDTAKAYKGASGQQSLLLRSKMAGTAKQIINAIKEPGETPFEYSVQVRIDINAVAALFTYCYQMAEIGALRMLMELKVFDQIPQQGSISYRDLAASIGAEESLLSELGANSPQISLARTPY